MWVPESIETNDACLDFSSSGQGLRHVRELLVDGAVFSNGIEISNWAEDPIQLLVCEDCGHVHCSPGNWVSARKAGEYVVFIPAFSEMLAGSRELDEYAPPLFIKQRGAAVLGRDQYLGLQRVTTIPDASRLKALTRREVVLLLQWEAPEKILGEFPASIHLDQGLLLGTDQESDERAIEWLNHLIADSIDSEVPVALTPVSDEMESVSFFLDTLRFRAWQPVVTEGDQIRLVLEPGYVVEGT
jgi:hypothetical protein